MFLVSFYQQIQKNTERLLYQRTSVLILVLQESFYRTLQFGIKKFENHSTLKKLLTKN